MSTHKYIDKLCAAALVLCLLLTAAFMNGEALGVRPAASVMGYETRLFDTARVHTIDIVMDDWDGFLETRENEEYAQCAVVIDGEAYQNTAIRAKGNTSLTMVSAMDSDRYSFKLEFDHYNSGSTYYGLDKLSLNNIIQDTTYMKDYLTYQMMGAFGVDAPLCSYVFITVNGQDWGLYLAVEGVEDGFLRRNYGSDPGKLYKPDSMSFGGGRGNGREFDMKNVMGFGEDGALPSLPDGQPFCGGQSAPDGKRGRGEEPGGMGGGPGGGMGSDDVKLRYIDDDPDSYPNIFQNAKTDVTKADQARLIASLKALNDGENLEEVLDIDEVLRYFVVHNFVRNGDSYTGSMVHNYYLYEEEGRLSMIPWDYNLAYGTFQGGDADSEVNAPIDSPVSGGDSRPMVDWIFASPEYTELYHQYLRANNIKGVDISFGIDQYDRTTDGVSQQTTSYSYRVSKTLFNDRFKIIVGGNYSTDANSDENFSENLINDIAFEYMLNKSGSMYVRLFRHTGYESILEGEITQTGVGFVLRRKVNSLRDLFRWVGRLRNSIAGNNRKKDAETVENTQKTSENETTTAR